MNDYVNLSIDRLYTIILEASFAKINKVERFSSSSDEDVYSAVISCRDKLQEIKDILHDVL